MALLESRCAVIFGPRSELILVMIWVVLRVEPFEVIANRFGMSWSQRLGCHRETQTQAH